MCLWGPLAVVTRRGENQIAVELAIIEGAQLDPYRLLPLSHATGESEEGCEPVPRRVGIGRREILVSGPHAHIRQRQLQTCHDLIFAVLQLVHRLLLGLQLG